MTELPSSPSMGSVPTSGVLLGLDFGTKRLGAAVSTSEQTMSLPLETYERRSDLLDTEWLKRIVREYRVVGLVIGLPVHMSGQEGEKARMARAFGEWANAVTGLPVAYGDERYSSAAADHFLAETPYKKKGKTQRRDQLAAHVILSSFMESADRTAPPAVFQPLVAPRD